MLFGKARCSKIFVIYGAGGATKDLGDFWPHGPCFRSGFLRDLSFLVGWSTVRQRA